MAEPWVSVEQLVEHLGVTRDSIYRWIDRKGLPAHRVGRLWKFKVSEVDEWVRGGGADEGRRVLAGDHPGRRLPDSRTHVFHARVGHCGHRPPR